MPSSHLPPPQLVTTLQALEQLTQVLHRQRLFGLDTESNSLFAYHYRVCLIQVSTETSDYLIDPLALSDLPPLKTLVADPDRNSIV